ncbi:tyrosine-protein phosphatase [Actinoplanes sp. NPDC051346]|uniref:tyrosine-protein phosphatase n=1 Tax=Actinoplanes sp. NPDC051346 TaxID=3155048 RepID=UPI003425EEA8
MTVDPYPRTLSFSASYNFRDVGGYAGLDGRTVRWRRLFRSDSLHRLKGDDLAAFGKLGVRTVIDLRRLFEIEEHGRVPEAEGLAYHNLILEHVDWESVPEPAGTAHDRWLADRYLNFAEDGREGLASALGLIADPDSAPVVVHCMAGKDRTGVVCALTLALLGVPDAVIAEDYALTEVAMASLTEYLRRTRPDMVQDKYHMFDCPQDAMHMFLDDLRDRHGSVEKYVREIGLSAAQVAAMRDHLLEPS